MSRRPRAVLAAGALALVALPAAAGAQAGTSTASAPARADPAAARVAALDAAAGWRDSLEAWRAPALPTPGQATAAILVLDGPPAVASAPADRPAAARAISARQDALESTLASIGATVTFRYRMLIDAVAVQVPAGRLESLGALDGVAHVVPVGYLAPAAAGATPAPAEAPAGTRAPAVAAGGAPAHIALIDAGIDPAHPWLGGGIGPTFPIIGGADLVDGDADPTASAGDPALEAHGTQMASLVLRSPALAGLAPSDVPRLLAYRVVAPEAVGGRVRPLARTDRVLAALEDAVDPNGDGSTADAAQVILLGLAGGFDGGGEDPLADALREADRAGATVVAPAGNDGPTFARPGSVGGPAAVSTVIAVGGESADRGPRTADLDARLGPAAARLGPLPLMGPDPGLDALPVQVLRDDAGVASGAAGADFLDGAGHSRVAGALVVVRRGDAPIAQVAARASAAGAAALAIWDEDGDGAFPAIPGDGGLPLPVVGLGSRQGAALVGLLGREPGLAAALTARPLPARAPAVASFSSWGPTPDGRQKPDLVAPAVDREAAWPGRAADGAAREAPLTGTSAAAADVAALALRLRIDRPELGPRAVASLLVQSAEPLPGVSPERQGAGQAAPPGPAAGTMRIEPAIVSPRGGRATVVLHDLVGRTARYRLTLRRGGAATPLGAPVVVRAGGAARRALALPGGAGTLVVQDALSGETVARAPVIPARPAATPADALGTPRVRVGGSGMPEVRVRLGLLRRADGRLRSARLHSVRLELLPQAGGDALPVAGARQDAAWPAGTYRFLVARRLASGLDVPAGAYRLRVIARGSDGRTLRRVSAPFTLS